MENDNPTWEEEKALIARIQGGEAEAYGGLTYEARNQAGFGTFTMNHIYGFQSVATDVTFQWDLRLGVQVSKILSPNLELLGSPFYRMSDWKPAPQSQLLFCIDGPCSSGEPGSEGFSPAVGVGMHAGIRV